MAAISYNTVVGVARQQHSQHLVCWQQVHTDQTQELSTACRLFLELDGVHSVTI